MFRDANDFNMSAYKNTFNLQLETKPFELDMYISRNDAMKGKLI